MIPNTRADFLSRHLNKIYVFVILAAGFCAYQNSFNGAFVFDDFHSIVDNEIIKNIAPWRFLRTHRPIAVYTFALNYSAGQLNVFGYHLVNLIIHLAAGLTLFGIARLTLLSRRFMGKYVESASPLAFVIAILWTVHPLNTQSVTYIVQREESLMGLCYLLTLYFWIRGANTQTRPFKWYLGSALAFLVGLYVKEIILTAPLIVFAYDRIFLSRSLKELLNKRKLFYIILVIIPLALATRILTSFGSGGAANVGGALPFGPQIYAWTQTTVIPLYLKLCIWPYPLSLSYYSLPLAQNFTQAAPHAIFITLLIILVFTSLKWAPAIGFLGLWFFVILSPSSSIFPLGDLVMEHRMYLSLIAVIAMIVLALNGLLNWLTSKDMRKYLKTALTVFVLILFCVLTRARNTDYYSWNGMLLNMLERDPLNARAHRSLAIQYYNAEKFEEAIPFFQYAISIFKKDALSHKYLVSSYEKLSMKKEASETLKTLISFEPTAANKMLLEELDYNKESAEISTIDRYSDIVKSDPHNGHAYNNLGNALAKEGRFEEARSNYLKAMRVLPQQPNFPLNMGFTYLQEGQTEKALEYIEKSLSINPAYEPALKAKKRALKARPAPSSAAGKSTPTQVITKKLTKNMSLDEVTKLIKSGEL